MKTAVIYATKTNHSKKIATAVASAFHVEAKNITNNPEFLDEELLFIVSGIYGGVSMPELIEYIKKLKAPFPKKAAIITSCTSGKQKQELLRSALEEKGMKVIDEFVCKGSFLFFSMKHPNDKDLQDAIEFALNIASKKIS